MIESARCGTDSAPKQPENGTRRPPWPTPAAGKATRQPRAGAGRIDDQGWGCGRAASRASGSDRYERLIVESLLRTFRVRRAALSAGRREAGTVAIEAGFDRLRHAPRRLVHRIARQVCISCGRLDVAVTEHFADRRQALAERQRPRGEAVATVVKPQAVKPGALPDPLPGTLQVAHAAARPHARHDMRIALDPGRVRQRRRRGRRQLHRPRTRLGVAWMEYRPNPPYYMKKN